MYLFERLSKRELSPHIFDEALFVTIEEIIKGETGNVEVITSEKKL